MGDQFSARFQSKSKVLDPQRLQRRNVRSWLWS